MQKRKSELIDDQVEVLGGDGGGDSSDEYQSDDDEAGSLVDFITNDSDEIEYSDTDSIFGDLDDIDFTPSSSVHQPAAAPTTNNKKSKTPLTKKNSRCCWQTCSQVAKSRRIRVQTTWRLVISYQRFLSDYHKDRSGCGP
jgi:hypothetical protein